MLMRPFGNHDEKVSVIGQGTWLIGGRGRAGAVAALKRGLDLGMTHIDTAEMYGDAPRQLSPRRSPGGATRFFSYRRCCRATRPAPEPSRHASARCRGCETDRLDCYLLHWRGSYPLEDTFAAFEELKQAGKILSWGVSNFDVDDLDEALDIVGEGKIACNQVLYHLEERAIEHAVIPWCEKHEVAVVAYSPFGHGRFPSPSSAGGRVLQEIAGAHGATPRQVALAFLTRRPSVFAIPEGVERRARRGQCGGRRPQAHRCRR